MSKLTTWWRRVFGEPAPLEHASMDRQAVELSPDRQAMIDALSRRQHDQANKITAATGQAYITRRRQEDGAAIHREAEFWERAGRQ